MVSNLLERRNKTWTIRTEVASDLTVRVGTSTFHLHKLPMVSRSGYLNRLVFRNRSSNNLDIQIDNFPGGTESFESIIKFCYGMSIDLTVSNVAPLYCTAHFLEMIDEYIEPNLVSRTEAFLSFIILNSWKDTFRILKSCESLSPWATELKIVKRCSESIASRTRQGSDKWWYEDVSSLRIDHFIEVVGAIKKNGTIGQASVTESHRSLTHGTTGSKVVGECIEAWTRKWLSRVTLLDNHAPQKLTYQLQRVTIENLIRLLPLEKGSVSCDFLLKLLKLGLKMEVDPNLVTRIDMRIVSVLDRCRVVDLLVEKDGSGYDSDIVVRVVKSYVSNGGHGIRVVGRLIDGFMAYVAREKGLSIEEFGSLVESVPRSARNCDDSLYRAIDMFLKAHPYATEEERINLCRAMDYHKLSKEAREHAMKNDRLPLSTTTRFILLEQVNFTKSVTTGTRSSFERTRTQMVIQADDSKGSGNCGLDSGKEIKIMRKEVDLVKSQLRKLQMCKMELQGQIKTGVK